MDWKDYEKEIWDYFRSEYADAKFTPNAKVLGRFSKVERQIDLLIEGEFSDFKFRVVIDGKFWKRKLTSPTWKHLLGSFGMSMLVEV